MPYFSRRLHSLNAVMVNIHLLSLFFLHFIIAALIFLQGSFRFGLSINLIMLNIFIYKYHMVFRRWTYDGAGTGDWMKKFT